MKCKIGILTAVAIKEHNASQKVSNIHVYHVVFYNLRNTIRNLTCMMEVKRDEKQAAVLDKGEEDECLVELHYIGTMF
ncbi:electrogenic sodium bicarbonate cotransporter 1 [Platysternon megacephalum]|uniref:Electrogenic sodium bicarbonate cotransporter 1 n=1 Tax=Platysternon megacephalum TaxID=55544 RepID=A0A4D9DXL6_9SAUR|nr:electrogenic sodium bicarbonate cotransporter 1 [Platysternon megacephalum]